MRIPAHSPPEAVWAFWQEMSSAGLFCFRKVELNNPQPPQVLSEQMGRLIFFQLN